jgi:hypothetical protein
VALGVTEIERVNHHADVGGVFAGLAQVRDLDQFKRCLVQVALERFAAVEIAVRFLDYDVSL